ncbi:hypothetical protein DPMN_126849 [Dreissena polymorpha]|uniref:Uncharacterized protein n=1 Tax=Dreissena polymorpha TaxID=45954 RepID=A0A9D4H438_DREPO|nr:hypothetical protein DPMN_126849 [Dreissena polymorpha]
MANNSDGCKKGLPLHSLIHILSDDASTPPHGGDYDDDATQQPEAGYQLHETRDISTGREVTGTKSISEPGVSDIQNSAEDESMSQSIISGTPVSCAQKKGRTGRATRSKQNSKASQIAASQTSKPKPKKIDVPNPSRSHRKRLAFPSET